MDVLSHTQNRIEESYYGSNKLETLDHLEAIPETAVPKKLALDILKETAKIGIDQMEEMASSEIVDGSKIVSPPTSFDQMLDTSTGNFIQRATKLWIKPQNPEGTIKLLENIGVDKVQDIVKKSVIGFANFVNKTKENNKKQTNYTLGDSSLSSLLDQATNQTTFNEIVHLLNLPIDAVMIFSAVSVGDDVSLALGTGLFILNSYLVLAQRYSRARFARTIDKVIKRHKEFDLEEYSNLIGLRLPGEE